MLGAIALRVWVWPLADWHLNQKLRLIGFLQELQAPALHPARAGGLYQPSYTLVHHGVRIGFSTPLAVYHNRVIGEGFSLHLSPLQENPLPAHFFHMTLNALAVTQNDIRAASGFKQRITATSAVMNKGLLLGGEKGATRWNQALYLDSEHGKLIAWSRPEAIGGLMMSADETRGWNLILTMEGITPDDAWDLLSWMRFVPEEGGL